MLYAVCYMLSFTVIKSANWFSKLFNWMFTGSICTLHIVGHNSANLYSHIGLFKTNFPTLLFDPFVTSFIAKYVLLVWCCRRAPIWMVREAVKSECVFWCAAVRFMLLYGNSRKRRSNWGDFKQQKKIYHLAKRPTKPNTIYWDIPQSKRKDSSWCGGEGHPHTCIPVSAHVAIRYIVIHKFIAKLSG